MFSFRNDPEADGVGIAFTDRDGGYSHDGFASFNLGRTDLDDLSALRANMDALRAALGDIAVVTVHQVHGVTVLDVDADVVAVWGGDSWLGDGVPGRPPLPIADAMVTAQPGVGLMIRVADCLPVLFGAQDVVGAAHAGRVGLADGVLVATLDRMRELGAGEVTAWIGPHICGACYEVPSAMQADFAARHPAAMATTTWATPAIDLAAAAQAQLEDLGCRVVRVDPCTRTTPSLFSHRRDGGAAGRQAGVIWLPVRH